MTWYDNNWNYRKPITISNIGSTLTDYQVLVTMDTASLVAAGKLLSNCNDIRFTSSDGSALISYWIESGCNTALTKIWVKIPSIANGNNTIYIYYGNSGATSESNYFSTFDIFGNGSSGILTVSSANTIVNNYTYLTGNENSGDNIIAVDSGTGFSNGDEILIVQMQNYSAGTAGQYEFRKILSGEGTTSFTLDTPLKGSYTSGTFNSTNATVTQVVRIPQYTNITINSLASIIAPAWDGYKGGIVIFRANGIITNSGDINVTAKGFRGGLAGTTISWPGDAIGLQGEGTKGKGVGNRFSDPYGGGGAGQQTSSPRNDRSGGGGGGYGTAGSDGIAQTYPEYRGRGGATYGSSDLSTIFFGSGGGGDSRDGPAFFSGNGGGIVIIYSSSINGLITTKGEDGIYNSEGASGGAGGSIFITSVNISSLTTNASYGTGSLAAYCPGGCAGGNGGYGRIRLSANSISGTSDPTAYTTGFDTVHNRKYASPEPSFGVSGAEELNITATLMTLNTNTCAGPCQIIAGVTWQNMGSSSVTFTPAILIDGTTIAYATSNITIGPYPAEGSSTITTPTLLAGTHQICPYPN